MPRLYNDDPHDILSRATLAMRTAAETPRRPSPSPVLTEAQKQARAAARQAGRDEVAAIAQACNAADRADLLASFLARNLTLDQVRAELGLTSPATPGATLVDGLCAAAKRMGTGAAATMWERGFEQARQRVQ